MIKIHDIKDSKAFLFDPNKKLVGEISSVLQLQDIRIQIQDHQISGYSILWEDQEILIDHNGYLNNWPKGFFDIIDLQLAIILGCGADTIQEYERVKYEK